MISSSVYFIRSTEDRELEFVSVLRTSSYWGSASMDDEDLLSELKNLVVETLEEKTDPFVFWKDVPKDWLTVEDVILLHLGEDVLIGGSELGGPKSSGWMSKGGQSRVVFLPTLLVGAKSLLDKDFLEAEDSSLYSSLFVWEDACHRLEEEDRGTGGSSSNLSTDPRPNLVWIQALN